MAALEKTGGATGAALQAALRSLDTELISGRVRLDNNRAAVVSTALTRLGDRRPHGGDERRRGPGPTRRPLPAAEGSATGPDRQLTLGTPSSGRTTC